MTRVNPTASLRECSRTAALLLVAVVCALAIFASAASATASPAELFEPISVATGTGKHQTVLTGFFLGGGTAELVVLRRSGRAGGELQMYGLADGAWEPALEAKLPSEIWFVDVVDMGGRDRLIAYGSGGLSWLDPETGALRPLLRLAASYSPANERVGEANRPAFGIPRVDISHDLNGDGLDDLVMPEVDGFWISTQSGDGSFTDFVKLGPPEPFRDQVANQDRRSYGEAGITALTVPWYLSRIHRLDYDQDGRQDLVFWNQDHFDVYYQDPGGSFDPSPETFTTEIPFDSDGVYSLIFGYEDESAFRLLTGLRKRSQRTLLHSLRDLNGDEVADLATLTLAGRSVIKQKSLYEVHYGTATAEGTSFERDASTTLQPKGLAGGLQPWGYSSHWLRDFDGDGRVDAMMQSVKIGVGGMLRALVGNSVGIDLEFYRNGENGFPARPTTTRRIRRFAPFAGAGNVFFPNVLMGDVDGDGRDDLLVGHSPKELHVFLGVPGPEMLERQPHKVAVTLPYNERDTWLVDLNRDGKQDVLIHDGPSSQDPGRPQRITTLIAR